MPQKRKSTVAKKANGKLKKGFRYAKGGKIFKAKKSK